MPNPILVDSDIIMNKLMYPVNHLMCHNGIFVF